MQITNGIRSVLSYPALYSLFQSLMGARKGWQIIVSEFLKPKESQKILDIGCGPGDVLAYLPDNVEYWGFDISQDYIQKAKEKYKHRGKFSAKILTSHDIKNMPVFDTVLMSGVLHHLDDNDAIEAISLAKSALKDGGRLITVDPCYVIGQNPIARYLISKDRGQNVRDETGYFNLANSVYSNCKVFIRHKSWIPYTHCFLECTK